MLHRRSSPRPAAQKAQGLDLLEAAHRDRVYPLIFCHIVCEGVPDVPRLRRAIRLLSGYVPEISAAYDFARGVFVDKGLEPDALIAEGQDPGGDGAWNLGAGPQLKIGLRREAGGSSILIGMSHILSDGAGFLQVLYLLAALYNGDCEPAGGENERDIGAVLRAAPVRAGIWGRRRTGTGRTPRPPRLCLPGEGERSDCLSVSLAPDALDALRQAAKRCAVTLNDVFLTAYARAAARVWRTDRVALPCPVDLRRFRGGPAGLTVANMTGLYRLDLDGLQSGEPFAATLGRIHAEMARQKSGGSCFAGLSFLHHAASVLPVAAVEFLCKTCNPIPPLGYTNVGVIDAERLRFQGCAVTSCFVSGTHRLPPDFQLSVSTFRDECTLSAGMVGSAERLAKGRELLERVKRELAGWAGEPSTV